MSFSQIVKQELGEHVPAARHCRISEISAILAFSGELIWAGGGAIYIKIRTENRFVANKYFTLLKKTFTINTNVAVRWSRRGQKSRLYTVLIRDQGQVCMVLEAIKHPLAPRLGNLSRDSFFGWRKTEEENFLTDGLVIQNPCCKRAFVRGAFLAAGSISDPEKSYHLEIVCRTERRGLQMQSILQTFGLEAKIVARKKHSVVYVKEGNQIVDLLNIMEAHVSLMELENIRIRKEIANAVNRKVNCETANISKTVEASVQQQEDILLIQQTVGLETLSEELQELAQLRLDNPGVPLKELGTMLSPPLGKSGVNHRLRKLKEIAESLRR